MQIPRCARDDTMRLFDLRQQCERDPVGPPESILRVVFASARPLGRVEDVVFLHHAARGLVGTLVQLQPAPTCLVREIRATIPTYALDREPLERRPAVRPVPLLPRAEIGRHEAAGLEEI